MTKLELHVFPHNDPAIALYERLGYAREGLRHRPLRADRRRLLRRDPDGQAAVGWAEGWRREKSFFRPEVEALAPYQPGKPIEDVQRELGLQHVVKLASNEGPYPPFPAAIEAMSEAAAELNRYPDGGSYRLHEALAERHGVHSRRSASGSGADGCIDMLSQAVLGAGRRGRLRLAVVRELPDLRRQAGRDVTEGAAPRAPLRPRGAR